MRVSQEGDPLGKEAGAEQLLVQEKAGLAQENESALEAKVKLRPSAKGSWERKWGRGFCALAGKGGVPL